MASPGRAESDLPTRLSPMLAETADEPFDSERHLFEIKWDGIRCVAFIQGGTLRLQNRRFVELGPKYPELLRLRELPSGTILDGEIVVLQDGKPSFPKLQERDHLIDPVRTAILSRRLPATLIVFDLLYAGGECLMELPLLERRHQLKELMERRGNPHLVLSSYMVGAGRAYFAEAERIGLEGIIAKRLDSPYLPGKRSAYWLKIKPARTAEFEILGYVVGKVAECVGALLIGQRSGDTLIYKGKVGSGLSDAQREELFQELLGAPPLPRPPRGGPAGAVWRKTNARCVVRFFETTESGKLRAPVFVQLIR